MRNQRIPEEAEQNETKHCVGMNAMGSTRSWRLKFESLEIRRWAVRNAATGVVFNEKKETQSSV